MTLYMYSAHYLYKHKADNMYTGAQSNIIQASWQLTAGLKYTVSQKKLGHFFTAYNFRNIEQIFTKFGTNQSLFILNIVPEFI